MQTTINLQEFGSVLGALLVIGGILKNAFPSLPNRLIPLITWGLGVVAYLALTKGWANPQQWVEAFMAAASATGIHSAMKNTLLDKTAVAVKTFSSIQPALSGAASHFQPSRKPDPSAPTSKPPLLVACLIGGLATLLAGCASFTTTQTDTTYEAGKPTREIITRASSRTLFESKSSLANFKANQTDANQSAEVGALTQEAGSTNTAATVRALVDLVNSLK